MAETDELDDLELTDEEKERRRAAAASVSNADAVPVTAPEAIGTPLTPKNAPAGTLGVPLKPVTGVFPTPETENSPLGGDLTPPSAPSIGTPLTAPAQPHARPNYDRYQELLNSKAGVENKHGFGGALLKGLDIAGSIIAPGQTSLIPGTRLHHQAEINRAARAAGVENAEIGSEGEEAFRNAETERQQAEAARANRPVSKIKPVTLQDEQGNPIAASFDPSTGKYLDENGKEITNPKTWERAQQVKPAHISYDNGIPVSVTDGKGNVYDVNDPKLPSELKPLVDAAGRAHGQHVKEQADTSARALANQEHMFEQRQNAPTQQERNAAARASIIVKRIPAVIDEINSLGDQLGPISGRWSEFMQGKVGGENPQFAGLRADLTMVSTGVALAHAVGRLPENLREEFDRMINAPQQDPKNIVSTLQHVLPFIQDTVSLGGAHEKGVSTPEPTEQHGGIQIHRDASGRIVGVE